MTRLLPGLFLAALTGVLVAAGVVLGRQAPVLLAPYALVVLAALWLGRRRTRPAPLPPGRTCACCTSTVHDPVEVR